MEQEAQPVVDEHGFGGVPTLLERFHQDPVAALAERSERDEAVAALLGLGQGRSTESEPCRCDAFQPAQPNVIQPPPPVVQPGHVEALEQRSAGHVVRDACRAPGFGPLAGGHMRLGTVQRLERRLDVDERVGRQHELDL